MDEKRSEKGKFDRALLLVGGTIFIAMIIIMVIFLGQMITA